MEMYDNDVFTDYLIVQIGDDLQMKCYKIDIDGITYKELTEEILLKLQEERSALARGLYIVSETNEDNNGKTNVYIYIYCCNMSLKVLSTSRREFCNLYGKISPVSYRIFMHLRWQ